MMKLTKREKHMLNRIDELTAYKELCDEDFGFCYLSNKEIDNIIKTNNVDYQKEIEEIEGRLLGF